MIFSYALSFLAGSLTTLSPCVLPVLPFVLSSSMSKNRLGPIFLSLGVIFSFTAVTVTISSTGHLFGISSDNLKIVGALFLLAGGVLFLNQKLADKFTEFVSARMQTVNNIHVQDSKLPLIGQLINGLLLGLIWTPCSGPSLGIAIGLTTKSETVFQAASFLATFALGSTLPLIVLAYGARSLIAKAKTNLKMIAIAKRVFGLLMMVAAIFILTGIDKKIEAHILNFLPEWWIDITTKF
tara:strand:- start:1982 stop:2698 length:717 start_codon:yes stop_codon:yes gene_type:complete